MKFLYVFKSKTLRKKYKDMYMLAKTLSSSFYEKHVYDEHRNKQFFQFQTIDEPTQF